MHVVQTVAGIAERSGGPPRTLRDLCEALGRSGARVTLLAGHNPQLDDTLVIPDPALARTEVLPAQTRLGADFFDFAAALERTHRETPGTILHDNGIWLPANWQAAAAARRRGLAYVVSPHGMLDPYALAFHRRRKQLAWLLYQHRVLAGAVGLVATAERELQAIRSRGMSAPVAVIPNGVACPKVAPNRDARLAPASRTLLFLSRLHPTKNIVGLLDAWALLIADGRFDDWTLRIAGPDEGGHEAELRARAAKLGGRVSFVGPVKEASKASAFADADLLVLPSHTESFGIVIAEALAHGLPVIASHGTPWAQLVDEACGWWTAGEPEPLAATLGEAMMTSAKERDAMGRRGRAFVARAFDWDHIAGSMLAYYEWLTHGGARPDFVDV